MKHTTRLIFFLLVSLLFIVCIFFLLTYQRTDDQITENEQMPAETNNTQIPEEISDAKYASVWDTYIREYVSHITIENPDTVFTDDNFSMYGLKNNTFNTGDVTFKIEISPTIAPFIFYISPSNGEHPGFVAVYQDNQIDTPTSIFPLRPNTFLADRLDQFFTAQDVNFDGYLDIGFPIDGGAKWTSYTFLIFDPETHTFVHTAFSNEFEKLSFNSFVLDPTDKRYITDSLYGDRTIYQVTDDHIHVIDSQHQEPPVDSIDEDTSCILTHTKYNSDGSVAEITTTTIDGECPGYPPLL